MVELLAFNQSTMVRSHLGPQNKNPESLDPGFNILNTTLLAIKTAKLLTLVSVDLAIHIMLAVATFLLLAHVLVNLLVQQLVSFLTGVAAIEVLAHRQHLTTIEIVTMMVHCCLLSLVLILSQ